MEEKKDIEIDIEDISDNEEIHEKGFLNKAALFFLEIIKIIILAGITIGLVRYFLFKPFYVKGQSMEPTFYEKDYLIIDEITYRFRGPERGEVVVLDSPVNEDHYLKRIVALPVNEEKLKIIKVLFTMMNICGD